MTIAQGLAALAAMPWPDACAALCAPLLCALSIGLLAIASKLRRTDSERGRRGLLFVLAITALAAAFNYSYVQYGRFRDWVNPYEFYHYYIGAKYGPELAYVDLYNATIIADDDTGMKYKMRSGNIRDLRTGGAISYGHVIANRSHYLSRFSQERWDEFVRDIVFFKSHLTDEQWIKILTDKGFNGTPSWSMIAAPLANAVPAGDGLFLLAALDAGLLLLAFAAIFWAFGSETALFSVIFAGTHMLMSHTHLKGAFLRTDWVCALVVAMCLIKKGRMISAGCLTAFAAMARLFPAIFIFGIGAKLFGRLAQGFASDGGSVRRYGGYLAGFAFTVAGLFAASIMVHGGTSIWSEYLDKIVQHDQHIGPWRIGFKYIFIWGLGIAESGRNPQELFEAHQLLWWSIQIVVLILCTLCAWRLRDDEAMALGFVPFFFLVAPTYYYYIILLLPFLFFVSRLEERGRLLGAVLLFAASIAAYVLYGLMGRTATMFLINSFLYLGVSVYMLLICAWSRHPQMAEGTTEIDALAAQPATTD